MFIPFSIAVTTIFSIVFVYMPYVIIHVNNCYVDAQTTAQKNISTAPYPNRYYFIPYRGVCPSHSTEDIKIIGAADAAANTTNLVSFSVKKYDDADDYIFFSNEHYYIFPPAKHMQYVNYDGNKNNIKYNSCRPMNSKYWGLSSREYKQIYDFLNYISYIIYMLPTSFLVLELITIKIMDNKDVIFKHIILLIVFALGVIIWSISIKRSINIVFFTADYWGAGDGGGKRFNYGKMCEVAFYASDGYVLCICVLVFTVVLCAYTFLYLCYLHKNPGQDAVEGVTFIEINNDSSSDESALNRSRNVSPIIYTAHISPV